MATILAVLQERLFAALIRPAKANPDLQDGRRSAFTLHDTPILYAKEAKQRDLPPPPPPRGHRLILRHSSRLKPRRD